MCIHVRTLCHYIMTCYYNIITSLCYDIMILCSNVITLWCHDFIKALCYDIFTFWYFVIMVWHYYLTCDIITLWYHYLTLWQSGDIFTRECKKGRSDMASYFYVNIACVASCGMYVSSVQYCIYILYVCIYYISIILPVISIMYFTVCLYIPLYICIPL